MVSPKESGASQAAVGVDDQAVIDAYNASMASTRSINNAFADAEAVFRRQGRAVEDRASISSMVAMIISRATHTPGRGFGTRKP